jgi:hypothetical protein
MPRTDEAKLQYWTKQIKAWKASGLSQRAYCEREGHKFPTFDYWRRQTRSIDRSAKSTTEATAPAKLTLVPVRMEAQSKSDSIVLRSPGGWQLTMPATIDSQWLAAFMRSVS